ncbi:uncharacterized protein LOC120993932 [Bufo bufo]|uniref:uncharacterized protein LOC120993932 n=1 Tax=Bufo bufo TaxID=8384 RepID=UPI001ABE5DA2|nr:uncharacterized protein LOC120993932 [Bufo bufo]
MSRTSGEMQRLILVSWMLSQIHVQRVEMTLPAPLTENWVNPMPPPPRFHVQHSRLLFLFPRNQPAQENQFLLSHDTTENCSHNPMSAKHRIPTRYQNCHNELPVRVLNRCARQISVSWAQERTCLEFLQPMKFATMAGMIPSDRRSAWSRSHHVNNNYEVEDALALIMSVSEFTFQDMDNAFWEEGCTMEMIQNWLKDCSRPLLRPERDPPAVTQLQHHTLH